MVGGTFDTVDKTKFEAALDYDLDKTVATQFKSRLSGGEEVEGVARVSQLPAH